MPGVNLSARSFGAAQGSAFSRPPSQYSKRVCRSLFGSVDHAALNREIAAKLREISERNQTRWNFNFTAGTPLHGDYEWEEIAVDATPTFYQESVQVGKRRAVYVHVNLCTEASNQENRARGDTGHGAAGPPEARRTRGTSRRRKRKTITPPSTATARITDFYCKRRKQELLSPATALCSEQTPQKRLR